ncbi:heterokaryon incompatibility protein-domain-containing protein [Camillea tinctor]|nr:heterokaryon incompatibility protein-domain-containing protein [Camillea tinctor]
MGNVNEEMATLGKEGTKGQRVDYSHQPLYQYTRLPTETSFRLLELFPGNDHAPVSYHLRVEDWTKPPEYEAVSYAWGDANKKALSICNGFHLMISNGLRDALTEMRYRNHARLLWVDAVCIDQANNDERGKQVSNMRSIYEGAKSVLVWLGKDVERQGERAVSAMCEIASECLHLTTGRKSVDVTELKSKDELWDLLPEEILVNLQCDTPDSWRSLAWLFSRPWFSRLWVLQEVNSNREVRVLCGSTKVCWDVVVLVASYIRHHPKIYLRWGFPESYYVNAYYMRRRYWLERVSLASLLNWGRSFDTSDPLDRVYALMGMPSFTQTQYSKAADYSRPKVELYTDITAWCIQKTESLRVLCYSQHLKDSEEFPSWVPQWDRTARYQAIEDSLTKLRWRSSGDTKLQAKIETGTRVIRLKGMVFDVIESQRYLGRNMWSGSQVSQDHPVLEYWEKQRSHPTITTYPTGESNLDALSLVLTTGLDHNQRKASENPASFKASFTAYLNQLLEITRSDAWPYKGEETGEGGDWFKYETLVRSKCYNRYLFSTRNGYLGLGPDCRAGDLVCLLFGGEVPFVLRPKDGHYQLVGDAYVHGIMEGEAIHRDDEELLLGMQFEIH